MKHKIKFQYIISCILIIVGCFLLICGLFIPPIGIIDNSILIAFGEILTFVGALFGIDTNYKTNIYNKIKGDKEE
ncbi:hypothetical protein D0T56_13615 [Dysgonomonas sp. 520]|nr:hypothetical protein [Dysgonomonas sp. 520]